MHIFFCGIRSKFFAHAKRHVSVAAIGFGTSKPIHTFFGQRISDVCVHKNHVAFENLQQKKKKVDNRRLDLHRVLKSQFE